MFISILAAQVKRVQMGFPMEKFSLLGVEDELISRSLLRFSIKALFSILGEQIERHFGRCFLLDFDEDLPSLLAILVDIFETSSPQAC